MGEFNFIIVFQFYNTTGCPLQKLSWLIKLLFLNQYRNLRSKFLKYCANIYCNIKCLRIPCGIEFNPNVTSGTYMSHLNRVFLSPLG
jgi:hypothetical protein